jgi:hypothetical protein
MIKLLLVTTIKEKGFVNNHAVELGISSLITKRMEERKVSENMELFVTNEYRKS